MTIDYHIHHYRDRVGAGKTRGIVPIFLQGNTHVDNNQSAAISVTKWCRTISQNNNIYMYMYVHYQVLRSP